jgi:cyd operon protein YbgT
MWYFAWVLGVTLAALAAILNGMWLEMHLEDEAHARKRPGHGLE